jgi:hypothetical protein
MREMMASQVTANRLEIWSLRERVASTESRKVVIGVRESAQPFSFADAHRQPAGYAVDLCLNAVDEIKYALKMEESQRLRRTTHCCLGSYQAIRHSTSLASAPSHCRSSRTQ